jgi:hypothetical protein
VTYRFIYSQNDKNRLIPSVLIDSRAAIDAIRSKTGVEIKAFTDSKVAQVTDTTLLYKIETPSGNLAGYFLIELRGGSVNLLSQQLRPAFEADSSEISLQIGNFITNGTYKQDYLF